MPYASFALQEEQRVRRQMELPTLHALLSAVLVAVTIIGFQFLISRASSSNAVDNNGWELRRKGQHAMSGILMVVFFKNGFVTQMGAFWTLLGAAAFGLCLHSARLRSPRLNVFLIDHLKDVLRPREQVDAIPSAFYNILGCAVTMLIGSADVAAMCVLMLALGDPAASLIGKLATRHSRDPTSKGKTHAGSLAMLLLCFATNVLYIRFFHASIPLRHTLSWAFVAAGAGALAERRPPFGLDDNLVVPIFPCVIMTGSAWALPGVFPRLTT
jgi:dolichol kinase